MHRKIQLKDVESPELKLIFQQLVFFEFDINKDINEPQYPKRLARVLAGSGVKIKGPMPPIVWLFQMYQYLVIYFLEKMISKKDYGLLGKPIDKNTCREQLDIIIAGIQTLLDAGADGSQLLFELNHPDLVERKVVPEDILEQHPLHLSIIDLDEFTKLLNDSDDEDDNDDDEEDDDEEDDDEKRENNSVLFPVLVNSPTLDVNLKIYSKINKIWIVLLNNIIMQDFGGREEIDELLTGPENAVFITADGICPYLFTLKDGQVEILEALVDHGLQLNDGINNSDVQIYRNQRTLPEYFTQITTEEDEEELQRVWDILFDYYPGHVFLYGIDNTKLNSLIGAFPKLKEYLVAEVIVQLLEFSRIHKIVKIKALKAQAKLITAHNQILTKKAISVVAKLLGKKNRKNGIKTKGIKNAKSIGEICNEDLKTRLLATFSAEQSITEISLLRDDSNKLEVTPLSLLILEGGKKSYIKMLLLNPAVVEQEEKTNHAIKMAIHQKKLAHLAILLNEIRINNPEELLNYAIEAKNHRFPDTQFAVVRLLLNSPSFNEKLSDEFLFGLFFRTLNHVTEYTSKIVLRFLEQRIDFVVRKFETWHSQKYHQALNLVPHAMACKERLQEFIEEYIKDFNVPKSYIAFLHKWMFAAMLQKSKESGLDLESIKDLSGFDYNNFSARLFRQAQGFQFGPKRSRTIDDIKDVTHKLKIAELYRSAAQILDRKPILPTELITRAYYLRMAGDCSIANRATSIRGLNYFSLAHECLSKVENILAIDKTEKQVLVSRMVGWLASLLPQYAENLSDLLSAGEFVMRHYYYNGTNSEEYTYLILAYSKIIAICDNAKEMSDADREKLDLIKKQFIKICENGRCYDDNLCDLYFKLKEQTKQADWISKLESDWGPPTKCADEEQIDAFITEINKRFLVVHGFYKRFFNQPQLENKQAEKRTKTYKAESKEGIEIYRIKKLIDAVYEAMEDCLLKKYSSPLINFRYSNRSIKLLTIQIDLLERIGNPSDEDVYTIAVDYFRLSNYDKIRYKWYIDRAIDYSGRIKKVSTFSNDLFARLHAVAISCAEDENELMVQMGEEFFQKLIELLNNIKIFKKADKLEWQATTYYELSRIYHKKNDISKFIIACQQAISTANQCIQLNPSSLKASEVLEKLRQKQHDNLPALAIHQAEKPKKSRKNKLTEKISPAANAEAKGSPSLSTIEDPEVAERKSREKAAAEAIIMKKREIQDLSLKIKPVREAIFAARNSLLHRIDRYKTALKNKTIKIKVIGLDDKFNQLKQMTDELDKQFNAFSAKKEASDHESLINVKNSYSELDIAYENLKEKFEALKQEIADCYRKERGPTKAEMLTAQIKNSKIKASGKAAPPKPQGLIETLSNVPLRQTTIIVQSVAAESAILPDTASISVPVSLLASDTPVSRPAELSPPPAQEPTPLLPSLATQTPDDKSIPQGLIEVVSKGYLASPDLEAAHAPPPKPAAHASSQARSRSVNHAHLFHHERRRDNRFLNEAINHLRMMGFLLLSYIPPVARVTPLTPDEIAEENLNHQITHLALLYCISRCFQALKLYDGQAIDYDYVDLRNMLFHHGAWSVSDSKVHGEKVVAAARDLTRLIPLKLLESKSALDNTQRAKVLEEYKFISSFEAERYKINPFTPAPNMQGIKLYGDLVKFHHNSDPAALTQFIDKTMAQKADLIWQLLPMIRSIFAIIKKQSSISLLFIKEKKLQERFLIHLQALKMLLTMCGELCPEHVSDLKRAERRPDSPNAIYFNFLNLCRNIRNSVAHEFPDSKGNAVIEACMIANELKERDKLDFTRIQEGNTRQASRNLVEDSEADEAGVGAGAADVKAYHSGATFYGQNFHTLNNVTSKPGAGPGPGPCGPG